MKVPGGITTGGSAFGLSKRLKRYWTTVSNDEAGVTELLAAAEHAHALAVVAAALLLDGLGSTSGLVELVDPLKARDEVAGTLADIEARARHALGVDGVPAVWRALAGIPFYLDATWQKERALMAEGRLTALDKRRVGLSVAMNARVR